MVWRGVETSQLWRLHSFRCPLDVTDENQWKAAIKFAEATFGHLVGGLVGDLCWHFEKLTVACSAWQDVLLNNGWFDRLARLMVHIKSHVWLLIAGIGGEYQHYMVPHDTSKDGIWKHPTADYRKILSVNQDSVYFGIREGAGSMLKNKVAEGKSIINISSDAAFGGNTGFAYVCSRFPRLLRSQTHFSLLPITQTASKWAVRGMSKHAALTLAPFNIRCSSIHPGIISTDIMNDAMGSRSEKEVNRIQDRWNKFHPMGRTGKAEEIAHLVVYLASPESSFTSGEARGWDLAIDYRLAG